MQGIAGDLESPTVKESSKPQLFFSKAQLDDIEALLRDIERTDVEQDELLAVATSGTDVRSGSVPNTSTNLTTHPPKQRTDDIHVMHVKNAETFRQMQHAELTRSAQARKEFKRQHPRTVAPRTAPAAKAQLPVRQKDEQTPSTAVFRVHAQTLEFFINEQLAAD